MPIFHYAGGALNEIDIIKLQYYRESLIATKTIKKKDKSMEKIPAPPMMCWKECLGSWGAFHKAAEKSVGRKLKKVTVKFSLL